VRLTTTGGRVNVAGSRGQLATVSHTHALAARVQKRKCRAALWTGELAPSATAAPIASREAALDGELRRWRLGRGGSPIAATVEGADPHAHGTRRAQHGLGTATAQKLPRKPYPSSRCSEEHAGERDPASPQVAASGGWVRAAATDPER